jgi:hypothetical protein
MPPLFADEADYQNWLSDKHKKYGHEVINGSIHSIVNKSYIVNRQIVNQKLFLDFDAGTSDANITNRLHFLLQ